MKEDSINEYKATIEDLENRIQEAEELIEAIKNGEVDAFAVNRNNISEIYTLQTSDFAYRTLIEKFGEGALTLTDQKLIVYTNAAFYGILGQSYEDVIGTNLNEWVTKESKAEFEKLFELGLLTNSKGEITLKGINNRTVPVYISFTSLKPLLPNVGVIITDLTEKKRNEEAKNKAEQIARDAEAAANSKQQFLSNMSHEIRTPMNAIIGFTKVILKTELTDKQREFLEAIKTSGDSLIVLINDILDLAKVNSGKMTFEQLPFKLESIINSIIQLFQSKVISKNLRINKHHDRRIPEIIKGDSVRLRQVLVNLVNNAIKFTDYGEIIINTLLVEENDEEVIVKFQVTDTGIGIDEKNLGTIFENFQQATDETTRLYGGTGLGLAIVKKLVEFQKGTLDVTSTVNVGSTFTFTLPFKKTTEQLKPEEIFEPVKDTSAVKVLLVEDNALNRLLMKTILTQFGFEHEVAGNGLIAIEKLKESDYDIILMDLQMPEMNGFEATDHIRRQMRSDIPIIALTADVTTMDLGKCLALGIDDYVAKPVDEKILYNKILRLVRQSEYD